jgi:hypothetical protein
MSKEKMDSYFSMFNCHVNNAFDKASIIFIAKFGATKYCETIAKYQDRGIMSIFRDRPTEETKFFVEVVEEIVNE